MERRVVAGAAALGLAVGIVIVAVLVVTGGDGGPAPLPVRASAPGAAPLAAEPAADSVAPARVTYEVEGELDELDGQARAWSVGAGAGVERIAALAEALDVLGPVRETPTGWRVGDDDEVLEVQRQPGLPWWFSTWSGGGSSGSPGWSPSGGEVTPAVPGKVEPESRGIPAPAPSGDDRVVCDMPDCPPGTACVQVCPPDHEPPPVDLPSRDDALERASAVFAAAGVDVAAAEVRADRFGVWLISADPEVGGLPTVGMASTATIGAQGAVEAAGGWLAAEAERGDSYSLVGTSEALRRLADDRPVDLGGGPVGPECLGCPGAEPVVVTITGVRLGLQLVPAYDAERAWLVPSYLFETREGGPGPDLVTFAVSDEDLVAPPHPPAVVPVEPGPPPADPVPPAPTQPGGPSGGGCAAVMAGSAPGGAGAGQPPALEVCQVGPARAGQAVTFELKATDADSGLRDDCGSPVASFGDEGGGVAVCDIGCVSLPPGPGQLHRSFEHVYAEPGTYTATFTLVGCGPDSHPDLAVQLSVPVAP